MKKKKKIIAVILSAAMMMTMTPAAAFAYDTLGTGDKIKTIDSGGITYVDIYGGKTAGRPDVTDTNRLLKDALFADISAGESTGADTAVKNWANLAAYIFASNSRSYFSVGDEGGVGNGKSADIYRGRFLNDVQGGKDYYGNAAAALSSKDAYKKSTGSISNNKFDRKADINMLATGMQSASNLNQVQEAALQSLVDVCQGKVNKGDFKKYNELKGMTEDTGNSPVLYTLMASRDRYGGTFHYGYNLFGLAFYDFNLEPVSGPNGEGVTGALDGYSSLNEAIGTDRSIAGFTYSADAKTAKSQVKNTGTADLQQALNISTSSSEVLSNTVTTNKQISASQTQGCEFTFGKNKPFFEGKMNFEFTESELFESGTATEQSTEKSSGTSNEQTVTVPAHTVVEQVMKTEERLANETYDCPVAITFKTAVFSMNGDFYDDNAATKTFKTAQYQQRSFFTQFGNKSDTTQAHSSLKERAKQNADDHGYDKAHAVTRGVAVKHGTTDPTKTWDDPWIDYLDWGEMNSALTGSEWTPAFGTVKETICTKVPLSVTGGNLKRLAQTYSSEVSDAIPLKPLKTVYTTYVIQNILDTKVDEDFNLRTIRLSASDADGVDFYGFLPAKGTWKLVNAAGSPIAESDAAELKEDVNGDFIVTGKKAGTAYVKYEVKDKAYVLADGSYVDPKSVKTPVLKIRVAEADVHEENVAGVCASAASDTLQAASAMGTANFDEEMMNRIKGIIAFYEEYKDEIDLSHVKADIDAIIVLRNQYNEKSVKKIQDAIDVLENPPEKITADDVDDVRVIAEAYTKLLTNAAKKQLEESGYAQKLRNYVAAITVWYAECFQIDVSEPAVGFAPKVTVKDLAGHPLQKGTDYTTNAVKKTKAGEYAVTVTGKGDYRGSQKVYYTVKPGKETIKSLKGGKHKFTVTYTSKKAQGADGVRVAWKRHSGKWQSVDVKNLTKTTKTNLKPGKYQVKVKAFAKINGEKHYGSYSKIKTVTVK